MLFGYLMDDFVLKTGNELCIMHHRTAVSVGKFLERFNICESGLSITREISRP